MIMNYKTQISVHADLEAVWDAVIHSDFIKDYFPEIKKDLTGMSTYILNSHRNPGQTFPTYVIPRHALGWTAGAGIDIALPRKDVRANFESIDIHLVSNGAKTKIMVETVYAPELNKDFFFVLRCIRGLMKIKLAVLKQDLEANDKQISWKTALA